MKTKLQHLETVKMVEEAISNNEKLIICAGRWGPMCIPVYRVMEKLESETKYKDIAFRVVEFDIEAAMPIREAKECSDFMGLPFTVYYYKQKIAHATSSIQSKEQLEENIGKYFL